MRRTLFISCGLLTLGVGAAIAGTQKHAPSLGIETNSTNGYTVYNETMRSRRLGSNYRFVFTECRMGDGGIWVAWRFKKSGSLKKRKYYDNHGDLTFMRKLWWHPRGQVKETHRFVVHRNDIKLVQIFASDHLVAHKKDRRVASDASHQSTDSYVPNNDGATIYGTLDHY